MDEFLGISGNKSGLPPVCFGQRAHASAGGSRVRLAGQNCAFVRSRWISRSIHERSSRTVVASAFLVLQDGGVPVLRKAFLSERGAGHSVAALRFVAGVRSAAGQAVPVLYRGSTRGWQVAGNS